MRDLQVTGHVTSQRTERNDDDLTGDVSWAFNALDFMLEIYNDTV